MSITKISPSVVDFDDGITISTADNTDTLILTSTDADDNSGPNLNMYRNSSSAADADVLGQVKFTGKNDAGSPEDIVYGSISGKISDASDGTEDGQLRFFTMAAGTSTQTLTLESGNSTFAGQVIAPNGATSGYYLKQTGGTATPRVTNDGNNWTILRPGASGADVAINNYANSANLVIFTDEGSVGVGTSPDYKMHIFTSDSSAGAHANADDLFIENSGNAGMTIGSGTSSTGNVFFSDSGSTLSGQIEYRHSDDSLMFVTGGSNRLHLQGDGDVDIIDGNLVVASGHGIDFSSAADVATGETVSSSILNDYEEGTATISIEGTTTNPTITEGNTFTAQYTKIGNLVTIRGYTGTRTITNAGSGIAKINQLPFTNHGSYYGVVSITHGTMFGDTQAGYVEANQTFFYPIQEGSTSGVNFSTGTHYFMFSVTYMTT